MAVEKRVVYIDIPRKKRIIIKDIIDFLKMFFRDLMYILVAAMIIRHVWGYVKSYMFCPNYSEYTLENCKQSIYPIADKKEWNKLSDSEKEEIIEIISRIEFNYLGVPDRIKISYSDNLPEKIGGEYHEKGFSKEIILSRDILEDNELTLYCLLHETFHAYQHCYSRLYNRLYPSEKKLITFYKAGIYNDERKNYKSYQVDKDGYYKMALEQDAYKYCREQKSIYLERLRNKYV